MAAKNALLKPILKWVGGKRQLLDDILPLIPTTAKTYVEPFVGGAAVLLAKQPRCAVVNDCNSELINVYKVVRDHPDELLTLLKDHSKKNSRDYYYEVRAQDRTPDFKTHGPVMHAARIIYLNKTCYNGLYRVNSSGQINSPYGRYKAPNIINEAGIWALSNYLQGDIDLLCGDYSDVLRNLHKDSFVYLDPPYMPINTTSSFTGYTEGGFSYDEQVRLRDECLLLKKQGIHFVQSNSDCNSIRDLYEGFDIRTVQAKRIINAKGDRRGAINEVLISG